MQSPNVLENTGKGNSNTLNRMVASKKVCNTNFASKSYAKQASEHFFMKKQHFCPVFQLSLAVFSALKHGKLRCGQSKIGRMCTDELKTHLGQPRMTTFYH